MLLVIDYGMSNLRSVSKACESLGIKAKISDNPEEITKADKVILPGVGAFGQAMDELNSRGMTSSIKDYIASGKPFLGICLGLQLLFDDSEEAPEIPGLGVLKGSVVRFTKHDGLKVPHMGWNELSVRKSDCPILEGIPDMAHVYFVHSYFVKAQDHGIIAAECDYGVPFVAIAWKDNVFGVQFHPEKSQSIGLRVLKNFLTLTTDR